MRADAVTLRNTAVHLRETSSSPAAHIGSLGKGLFIKLIKALRLPIELYELPGGQTSVDAVLSVM